MGRGGAPILVRDGGAGAEARAANGAEKGESGTFEKEGDECDGRKPRFGANLASKSITAMKSSCESGWCDGRPHTASRAARAAAMAGEEQNR